MHIHIVRLKDMVHTFCLNSDTTEPVFLLFYILKAERQLYSEIDTYKVLDGWKPRSTVLREYSYKALTFYEGPGETLNSFSVNTNYIKQKKIL